MRKLVASLGLMLALSISFVGGTSAYAKNDGEGEIIIYDNPDEEVITEFLPDDLDVEDGSENAPIVTYEEESVDTKSVREKITVKVAVSDNVLSYVSIYNEGKDEIIYEKEYDMNEKIENDTLSVELEHGMKYVVEAWDSSESRGSVSFRTPSKASAKPTVKPEAGVSDTKAPVISFSGLPDTAYLGEAISVTVKTNEVCDITFNGETKSNTKKGVFKVYDNATFSATATDKSGNESQKSLKVKCFKSAISDQVQQSRYSYSSNSNKPISTKEIIHTGSVSYMTLIGISVVLIASGVCMLVIVRKRKGGSSHANKA